MKNIILALLIIIFIPLAVKSEERICFKTKDIENILFKKDRLIFENRRMLIIHLLAEDQDI